MNRLDSPSSYLVPLYRPRPGTRDTLLQSHLDRVHLPGETADLPATSPSPGEDRLRPTRSSSYAPGAPCPRVPLEEEVVVTGEDLDLSNESCRVDHVGRTEGVPWDWRL